MLLTLFLSSLIVFTNAQTCGAGGDCCFSISTPGFISLDKCNSTDDIDNLGSCCDVVNGQTCCRIGNNTNNPEGLFECCASTQECQPYAPDQVPGNGQLARCVPTPFITDEPTADTLEPTITGYGLTPEPTSAAPTVFFDNDYELTLCKKTTTTYSKITGDTETKKLKKKSRTRVVCETKKHAIEVVTASIGREDNDQTCAPEAIASCATNVVDGELLEDLQKKCNGKYRCTVAVKKKTAFKLYGISKKCDPYLALGYNCVYNALGKKKQTKKALKDSQVTLDWTSFFEFISGTS